MLVGVVLCLLSLCFYRVSSQGECTDLRGRVISHGLHYVPGPDTCTLCVCDNGLPKVCKAVLCSPPQDCRSFRVGNTCCEFICLDDVVKPAEGAEANVRVAASGAAAVVLLTVALVVYRVRRQKRRRPPHADDQRSLTSIGYISGSMGYMGGSCETALAAWKPPGHYMPRGEAPPPYDEAVAQCRQEQLGRAALEAGAGFHRSFPVAVGAGIDAARPDEPSQCPGHGYANIPRPIQQMANPQNCYNAPLLQPVHAAEPREPTAVPHHPLAPNVVGFPSAIRLTGSLGAISNRGLLSLLQREPETERHNVPLYTSTAPMHTSLHRTIPCRSGAALETCSFSRSDRSVADVRRSFHRAAPLDPRRSVPRNLNLAEPATATLTSNIRTSATGLSSAGSNSSGHSNVQTSVHTNCPTSKPTSGPTGGPTSRREEPEGSESRPVNKPLKPAPDAPPTQTLPLTVDQPSCVCSYEGVNASGAAAEETDDYRNECENCKATSNSRWAVEEGWRGEEEDGTQTLQRRAPPPAPPPPATATLPQPVTRQLRTVMGPPSNWENWFNTIPDSDTESEEE